MKKRFGVVHGIATCETCGWTSQSYKNAQATGAKHAQSKGHVVNGEVAYAYTYDGTEKT